MFLSDYFYWFYIWNAVCFLVGSEVSATAMCTLGPVIESANSRIIVSFQYANCHIIRMKILGSSQKLLTTNTQSDILYLHHHNQLHTKGHNLWKKPPWKKKCGNKWNYSFLKVENVEILIYVVSALWQFFTS